MSDDGSPDVVLLSGGNPQIAKGDGPEPVRAYLAAMPSWKGRIGSHIDALVTETLPDVEMAVRWNSPFYGIAGRGWFLSLYCFNKYVKVTFLNGAKLVPEPVGRGTQSEPRWVNIAEDDEIDDAQLADWFRQAAALPGEPLF